MLTILSFFFDHQLEDAVRNDRTGWDLQGNVTVCLNVCAVLHTHLRGGGVRHTPPLTFAKISKTTP